MNSIKQRCISVIVLFALLLSMTTVVSIQRVEAATGYKDRLGVNLDGLTDYSASIVFTDAMKTCRGWGKLYQPWAGKCAMDSEGWPTEDASVLVHADMTVDISGTYKLSFDGKADLSGATIQNQKYENGKTTADVVVAKGTRTLSLNFTNTNGGVKNVKLIRPDYVNRPNQTFTDELLAALEPFSTIRFMDWLNTNSQSSAKNDVGYTLEKQEWANRRTPSFSTQSEAVNGANGVAWEYVVELCNLLKKDAWINIPQNASEDYIRQCATFLKNNLDPDLKVYVEFSNEVWNWMFSAAQANNALAQNDPDAKGSYFLMYAKEATKMAKIFRDIYGQQEIGNRIRPVLAWQFGWNPPDSQPRDMLNFIKNKYEAPSNLFYSLAIAPYFSEPSPESCTSIEAVHNRMIESTDSSVSAKTLLLNLSKEFNLAGGVTCYEGGPHHQGQVETNLDIRIAAHRHANMQNIIVRDMKDNWFDLGGNLFCYFTLSSVYGKYGCWGLTEDLGDLTTPKYKAILQMANATTPTIPATSTAKPSVTTPPSGNTSLFSANFENCVIGDQAANGGKISQFEGWSSVISCVSANGGKALKAVGWGAAGYSAFAVAPLQAGVTYKLSFKANGSFASVSVNLCSDGLGLKNDQDQQINENVSFGSFTTSGWEEKSFTFSPKVTGSLVEDPQLMYQILFNPNGNVSEGILVDDIKLERVDNSQTSATTAAPTYDNPYTVTGELISGINNGDVSAFKASFNASNGAAVKVFKGTAEVTSGKVGTGMEVVIYGNGVELSRKTIVIYGDVNGDGATSVLDLLSTKAHILQTTSLKGAYLEAAKVVRGGTVSVLDLLKLKAVLLQADTITQ